MACVWPIFLIMKFEFCSLLKQFCSLPTEMIKMPLHELTHAVWVNLRELTHAACCYKPRQNLISSFAISNFSQIAQLRNSFNFKSNNTQITRTSKFSLKLCWFDIFFSLKLEFFRFSVLLKFWFCLQEMIECYMEMTYSA